MPRPVFIPESLLPELETLRNMTGVCVALSGGADSVALLLALAQLRPKLNKPLRAVHIHHGLQEQADSWADFCAQLCRGLNVPLLISRTRVAPQARESVEMAARRQRYSLLEANLGSGEGLLMAHHLDDQAETLLLNLLRGSGVDGLAGMPSRRRFGKGWLIRPLLGWHRASLQDWLRSQHQSWIEDASNADFTFDRNFLRHQILPLLEFRWPAVAKTLARSATLLGEQRNLNRQVTEAALENSYIFAKGSLEVAALKALSTEVRSLVLRIWLHRGWPQTKLSHQQLDTLQKLLSEKSSFTYEVSDHQLSVFKGALYKANNGKPSPSIDLDWRLDRPLRIPALGIYLEPETLLRQLRQLSSHSVLRVTTRAGGEVICLGNRGHRRLKKLLQAWGVEPQLRRRLLLLWHHDEIVAIPGYWVKQRLST